MVGGLVPQNYLRFNTLQVGKEVHGSTLDAASNMRVAFDSFEGASCVDHKIQNGLKTASKSTFIEKLEKACRGIVNHFRRSQKVCIAKDNVTINVTMLFVFIIV